MSDLQCPATVLLVPSETVASLDPARAFAGRRLSGVFVDAALASDAAALAAASDLAGAVDCRIDTLPALTDSDALDGAVEDLADLYRGETIVVVATAAVIQARLDHPRPPTEPVEVAVDSGGWVVRAP